VTSFTVSICFKWSLGRLRKRIEDNMRMELWELGCEDMKSVFSGGSLVSVVLNPQRLGTFTLSLGERWSLVTVWSD
jgi:hypothetical protein